MRLTYENGKVTLDDGSEVKSFLLEQPTSVEKALLSFISTLDESIGGGAEEIKELKKSIPSWTKEVKVVTGDKAPDPNTLENGTIFVTDNYIARVNEYTGQGVPPVHQWGLVSNHEFLDPVACARNGAAVYHIEGMNDTTGEIGPAAIYPYFKIEVKSVSASDYQMIGYYLDVDTSGQPVVKSTGLRGITKLGSGKV